MADAAALAACRGLLRAFAELAPTGSRRRLEVGTERLSPAWIGDRIPLATLADPASAQQVTLRRSGTLERLAAHDAVHRHQQLLRLGWGFVVGTVRDGDRDLPVRLPLVTRPVTLHRHVSGLELQLVGDPELTDRILDPEVVSALEDGLETARTSEVEDAQERWLSDAAAAARLPLDELRPAGDVPVRIGLSALRPSGELLGVTGAAIFAVEDTTPVDVASTVRAWSTRDDLERSAFASVYGLRPPAPTDPDGEVVRSLLPLTAAQQRVVASARSRPITVVSGAPGTGKSHALAAVATDAVARGRSVLVVTRSPHAAEVLADLLGRHPGPTPVVFGSGRRRSELAGALTGAGIDEAGRRRVRELAAAAEAADGRRAVAHEQVEVILETEALAATWHELEPIVPTLAAAAPRILGRRDEAPRFARAIADVRRRLTAAPDAWRTRLALRRLYRRAGADRDLPLDRLELAVQAAAAGRARAELQTSRRSTATAALTALLAAEDAWRTAEGALVDARAGQRDEAGRRTAAALAAALRAGRATRRRRLGELDPAALVGAVPLWIGTLRDVDDLLPHTPGMFDLVVLDEASQIDQPSAATALLRARAVVVAGDPAQLRHVSFVADEAIANALADHGVGHLADRVDVRRASAFDLAAAAAAPVWLDEHFRSVPHLIAFSVRRFYDRRLHLVTRHPSNERRDAIDVVHVEGSRDEAGVNTVEIDAVLALVEQLRGEGASSVGVVAPFRAQADALEEALLDVLPLEAIEQLGLRVGTVHALQGDERDVVIASWTLSEADDPRTRRFLEAPNLFNVLVTRARQRMVVVTSLRPDPGGLLGAYLGHAAEASALAGTDGEVSRWATSVADELARATGRPVRTGYPVGRWRIDLVVGDGPDATAVACDVHPAGPDAHIARHRTLASAGWRTTDAFATRFDDDPVAAALELAAELALTRRGPTA